MFTNLNLQAKKHTVMAHLLTGPTATMAMIAKHLVWETLAITTYTVANKEATTYCKATK